MGMDRGKVGGWLIARSIGGSSLLSMPDKILEVLNGAHPGDVCGI